MMATFKIGVSVRPVVDFQALRSLRIRCSVTLDRQTCVMVVNSA